jgi:hypothetical protein
MLSEMRLEGCRGPNCWKFNEQISWNMGRLERAIFPPASVCSVCSKHVYAGTGVGRGTVSCLRIVGIALHLVDQ